MTDWFTAHEPNARASRNPSNMSRARAGGIRGLSPSAYSIISVITSYSIHYTKLYEMKGVTGENLLVLLERRLDSMVYRLGFATSRNEARLLVRQGHFLVNRNNFV